MEYISTQRRYSPRTVALYREAIDGYYAFALPETAEVSDSLLREFIGDSDYED